MKEYDLAAPAVGSPFRSTAVWGSKPLKQPFVRPVALYRSGDHSLLGYQIGLFDRAVPPEVRWRGLQSVIMHAVPSGYKDVFGNDLAVMEPVLVPDLDSFDGAVMEHLGDYIA